MTVWVNLREAGSTGTPSRGSTPSLLVGGRGGPVNGKFRWSLSGVSGSIEIHQEHPVLAFLMLPQEALH